MVLETFKMSQEGAVLFVEIAAPPMNLLGPELVRDLVSLIQRAEADEAVKPALGQIPGAGGAQHLVRLMGRAWELEVT